MGYRFEVIAWEIVTTGDVDGYMNVAKYQGDSMEMALTTAARLKADGCGCVTIKWRGDLMAEGGDA